MMVIVNQLSLVYMLNHYYNQSFYYITPSRIIQMTLFFWYDLKLDGSGQNVAILTFFGFFITYVLLMYFIREKRKSDKFGSATFSTMKDIAEMGLIGDPEVKHPIEQRYGLIVGSFEDRGGHKLKRYDTGAIIFLKWLVHYAAQHVLLCAPTGKGKGVGYITPNLFTYGDSIFMFDMKGADYKRVAGHMQKNMGKKVFKFEPAALDGSSCNFNPLDIIEIGSLKEVSQAGNIAEMLIDSDGSGLAGDHWKTNGMEFLKAAILHVLYTKNSKSLTAVGTFLSIVDPDTNTPYEGGIKGLLGEMCGLGDGKHKTHLQYFCEANNISIEEGKIKLGDLIDEFGYHKTIKENAVSLFYNDNEKEVTGIINSGKTPTGLFRDPLISKCTSTSSFKLSDFQDIDSPIALFYVVMPEDQDRLTLLTRILITQIIKVAQRREEGKKHELVMFLDEFASLKRLPVIENAITNARSFKIRFFIVIQDISIIQGYYKAFAATLIAGCGIKIFLASNEQKTNEAVSAMTGDTTVMSRNKSVSESRSSFSLFASNTNISYSETETARKLLTPNEVATMNRKALIFKETRNVIMGEEYNLREVDIFEKYSFLPIVQEQPEPLNVDTFKKIEILNISREEK